jgi:hypothetical protein
MNNAVFWADKPCCACKNDVSGEHIASIIRMTKIGNLGRTLAVTSNRSTQLTVLLRSVLRLLVTAVISSSLILFSLMMEAIRSSEISVVTRAARHNIPDDGILRSHRRENLKSYIALTRWAMLLRHNVSPVRYELCFYIAEDGILQSCRSENLKYHKLN